MKLSIASSLSFKAKSFSDTTASSPAALPANQETQKTVIIPATILKAAYSHESTKPMNTIVAGLRTGLAKKKVTAERTDAERARRPSVTGAAQQVHIIPGRAAAPLRRLDAKSLAPINRVTHLRGISTCTNEPTRRPKTTAFQTAVK